MEKKVGEENVIVLTCGALASETRGEGLDSCIWDTKSVCDIKCKVIVGMLIRFCDYRLVVCRMVEVIGGK